MPLARMRTARPPDPQSSRHPNSACSVRGGRAERLDVWTCFASLLPHFLTSTPESCCRIRDQTSVRHALAACAAALLLALGAAPPAAHAQLGVTAGLNFAQAGDITDAAGSLDQQVVFDEATGYHVGLAFEFGGDRLRVRPGVIFRTVGTYSLPDDAGVGDAAREFDVSVIEIPIDVRLTVLPIPGITPYVFAGPTMSLPRGQGDFSDATRTWSLSGGVGTGLSIEVQGLKLQPEVRYQFGVTDYISDSFTIGNEVVDPADSPRFSAFGVRLNLMF